MAELNEIWREQSPAAWAESKYGWVGTDGKPIKLHPWQRAVLDAWWEHKGDTSTLGISNIKKTGKTFLDAVLVAWRWLALPGLHFCVANDLDQAQARQFNEVLEMVRRNPFLAKNVRFSARSLEFIPTQSVLQALSGDATGNAGANHLTVSHTEAWGVCYEQDIRNWEELTVPPGLFYGLPALRIADSYAGHLDESNTWHGLVDRGLKGERVSDEWPIYKAGGLLLFHIAGEEAQERCFRGRPEEAAEYYAEQRQTLRENSYRRLHLMSARNRLARFIDPEAWERLIDVHHHPLQAGSSQPVFVGLDLALSPEGDDCALIGLYGEGGLTKVAFHKVWKGGSLTIK